MQGTDEAFIRLPSFPLTSGGNGFTRDATSDRPIPYRQGIVTKPKEVNVQVNKRPNLVTLRNVAALT